MPKDDNSKENDLRKLILNKSKDVLSTDKEREIFHNRLVKLTHQQMKLLRLYFFESKSVSSIAKMLKLSRPTIYKKIDLILKKLKVSNE